jgi:hypothetical protein
MARQLPGISFGWSSSSLHSEISGERPRGELNVN